LLSSRGIHGGSCLDLISMSGGNDTSTTNETISILDSTPAEICRENGSGLIFPLIENEYEWNDYGRAALYLLFLGWCFMGVAIVSDIFMEAIERVTSKRRRKFNTATHRYVTVRVWNPTVANLTLMALGSSAPEILLSIIELLGNQVFAGDLGPSTIVGSAAFNLFIISAVCVMAIPTGEVRYIKETNVYIVTAIFSILAYVWLILILDLISPNVVEIWEAVVTFIFFPVLVGIAYAADIGVIGSSDSLRGRGTVITADMSPEELKDLEEDIRRRHGASITREQVAQIMEIECTEPSSIATYRRRNKHHKHKESKGAIPSSKIVPITEDEEHGKVGDDSPAKERCVFSFVMMSVACMENCGHVEVVVTRSGLLHFPASIAFRTKDGTATSHEDFVPIEGRLSFQADEVEKSFQVEIVDDDRAEDQEEFTCELYDPQVDGNALCQGALGDVPVTTIKIIDKDIPGILAFDHENDSLDVKANVDSDVTVEALIKRMEGASGLVSCKYRTEAATAQAGEDFEPVEGTLEFLHGECEKKIELTIKGRKRYEATQMFRVLLEEPEGGAKFDESTDGGDENCILTVFVRSDVVIRDPIDRIKSTLVVRWDRAKTGNVNWGNQFKDALFNVYGDDEDDGDEAEERSVASKATAWAFHIIQLPWKVVFASIPPTDYCGGWVCFCCSLIAIGLVTAVIGDVAAIFGCCLGIKAMGTAITFVALGTSLPDTFASKTAAQQDPHADASAGNVTGSNSVNVFLGLGMPWTIGAIYWTLGTTQEWRDRFGPDFASGAIDSGFASGAFIVKAGDLAFSVTIFSICACICVAVLFVRRRLFGGELGGPFLGKIVSAVVLVSLWVFYIAMSFWKMGESS